MLALKRKPQDRAEHDGHLSEVMIMSKSEKPVAIVTGAAQGIGAAVVDSLVSNGFIVCCVDLNESAMKSLKARHGNDVAAYKLDVSDEEAVVGTFKKIFRKFGRIDALATCAAVVNVTPFDKLTASEFRIQNDINVIGTFLPMREAAKYMQEGGRICTMSSAAGIRGGGIGGTAAYSASKGAVISLTKDAARSLGERGITVNCVSPALVQTPMLGEAVVDPVRRAQIQNMNSLKRKGEPKEIGDLVAWLLSSQASYVSGSLIAADGGLTMH